MITEEILNRILAERDNAHKQELARMEAEFKARSLETRLTAIEEKLKDADKDEEGEGEGIAGFKISDLMQAYTMYQQMQNPTK